MAVTTVSVRGLPARAAGIVYVGRACNGWEQSPLANPHSQHGREQDIALFKRDLWAAIKAGMAGAAMTEWQSNAWRALLLLVAMHSTGHAIVLGCWCKPLACHSDVVKAAIEWLSTQPYSVTTVGGAAAASTVAPVGMHMLAASATEF